MLSWCIWSWVCAWAWAVECSDLSNVFVMKLNTPKGSSLSPEELLTYIDTTTANTSSTFPRCNNFPIVQTIFPFPPSIPPPLAPPSKCAIEVGCATSIHESNLDKFGIHDPRRISCETWLDRSCTSAMLFMEAHNCSAPERCLGCCKQRQAVFDVVVFFVGTCVPLFCGLGIFIFLFFFDIGEQMRDLRLTRSWNYFKALFKSSINFSNNGVTNSFSTQQSRRSIPKSRSDIRCS